MAWGVAFGGPSDDWNLFVYRQGDIATLTWLLPGDATLSRVCGSV